MPRKTFTNGEVLIDSDINLYLSNEQKYTASTATAYTLQTAYRYYLLNFTSAGTITVTLSTATAFEAGERTDITWGTGVVQVVAGTGVTLAGNGTAATTFTAGTAYEALTVLSLGSNSYRVIGNVTGA